MNQIRNAMEAAFRKAVEDGTAKDKEAIKAAMFGKKAGAQIEARNIKQAPKVGKVSRDDIKAAVETVSKQNENKTPL